MVDGLAGAYQQPVIDQPDPCLMNPGNVVACPRRGLETTRVDGFAWHPYQPDFGSQRFSQ